MTPENKKKPLPLSDIIEWDIFNWSRVLPFWEKYLPNIKYNPKILTLGERNGGLTLWLALKGYQVMYSDIHHPKSSALELHRRYEVSEKISYEIIDIFRMPFDDNSFDAIICKSVIGGLKFDYKNRDTRTLENQRRACEEIRRVLKPGGIFLGAENMQGSHFHRYIRKKKGLDKGWRYLSHKDLQYVFSEYNTLEVDSFGFLSTSTRFGILNSICGYINIPLSFLLPKEQLYISFIAARK